jgi:hypothetical protein
VLENTGPERYRAYLDQLGRRVLSVVVCAVALALIVRVLGAVAVLAAVYFCVMVLVRLPLRRTRVLRIDRQGVHFAEPPGGVDVPWTEVEWLSVNRAGVTLALRLQLRPGARAVLPEAVRRRSMTGAAYGRYRVTTLNRKERNDREARLRQALARFAPDKTLGR